MPTKRILACANFPHKTNGALFKFKPFVFPVLALQAVSLEGYLQITAPLDLGGRVLHGSTSHLG